MLKRTEILILSVVIFFKFLFIKWIGVRFEYDWIYQMWHFIDVEYLKSDLLSSIYYFHYQPPVFNFFLGLVLKQSLFKSESLLFFLFNFMTVLMFLGMVIYYRISELGKAIYLIFPTIFLFLPQTIIYENWPIYTWTSSFLILMAYFALSSFGHNLKLRSFIFFLALSLLVLSRSAFHPVYYFFFLVFFLARFRNRLKEVILGAVVPTLLILSVMIKNKIEFGFMGVGSGLGFSLYKIVSKKELEYKIKKSGGNVDEVMKITPVKSISTYLKPEEIFYPERYKGINVLTDEFKTTRDQFGDEYSVNLGNIHYLDITKRYQKSAFYLIKEYPLEYIERVSKALIMFFKPSWDHGFGVEENKKILKNYMNLFYLESLRLNFENLIYKVRKPWPLRDGIALSSYILVPAFYFICLLLLFIKIKSFGFNFFVIEEKYFFSLITILYLVSVSSLIELAENDRYRVMIDPMVFVTLVSLGVPWARKNLWRNNAK